MKITLNTYLEEIINVIPDSIQYLQKKGIKCIACGEPVWGTLKEAASFKNISEEELSKIIIKLNEMIETK
jgi:methionine synthase II (cobalamin-independent)